MVSFDDTSRVTRDMLIESMLGAKTNEMFEYKEHVFDYEIFKVSNIVLRKVPILFLSLLRK